MTEVNVENVKTKLEKLAALGSADAIAWELEAQGVQGRKESSRSCAIARFLGNKGSQAHVLPAPGMSWVNVGGRTVGVISRTSDDIFRRHSGIRVPDVVSEFIRRFDEGEYPALEEVTTS